MRIKRIPVLLANRGVGCITRLQAATGGAPFNNLLADTRHEVLPEIDFVAHARRSEEHTSELQLLMRISYAVFCLIEKTHQKNNLTLLHATITTTLTTRVTHQTPPQSLRIQDYVVFSIT